MGVLCASNACLVDIFGRTRVSLPVEPLCIKPHLHVVSKALSRGEMLSNYGVCTQN